MFLIFSFGISLSYFIIYFFGRSRFLLEHTGSSSLTRDQTHAPALGVWSLNHWTPGKSQFQLLKVCGALQWCFLVAQWSTCQYRRLRCGFSPWIGKIPWRRAWQPTPAFLSGSRCPNPRTPCQHVSPLTVKEQLPLLEDPSKSIAC